MRPQLPAEAYFTPALKQRELAKTISYRSSETNVGLSTEMLHSTMYYTDLGLDLTKIFAEFIQGQKPCLLLSDGIK